MSRTKPKIRDNIVARLTTPTARKRELLAFGADSDVVDASSRSADNFSDISSPFDSKHLTLKQVFVVCSISQRHGLHRQPRVQPQLPSLCEKSRKSTQKAQQGT
tara:strand:- start:14581 stop:14892 length:312 start_codon:yes stop_codon:yes gene_type:complete